MAKLERAGPAQRIDVLRIAESRSTGRNGLTQHDDHRLGQSSHLRSIHAISRPQRIHVGTVKYFVAVDVADSGHHTLIEKRRLDGPSRSSERSPQDRLVEGIDERIGPEADEFGNDALDLVRREDDHFAERSRIDESDLGSASKSQHDVRVRRARSRRILHEELSAHPQVHHQRLV